MALGAPGLPVPPVGIRGQTLGSDTKSSNGTKTYTWEALVQILPLMGGGVVRAAQETER